jgi:A/G-specific adenine glycosylase
VVARLRRRLLRYYDAHARRLPWRETRDPYRIWISEVMLQQTRVATATERYVRFLARFPDVHSLARASEQQVCEEWAGLGYYARARNLKRAASLVVAEHGGRFPREATELRRLPGIGGYTAAAVASMAFGERAPAIDGNIERVLARVSADAGVSRGRPTPALSMLAAELVACTRPGDVNQALMDVGATLCTPKAPACERCPLRADCRACAAGTPERFPARRARTERTRLDVAFAWVAAPRGVWLERRPMTGLWSGLWQLPGAEGSRARTRLEARLGIELGRVRACIRHDLSHRRVRATVYDAPAAPGLARSAVCRPWLRPLEAPLSALARKAIDGCAATRS